MGKHYTQIDMCERVKIEAYYSLGMSATQIAKKLGRHHSTIYNELERGKIIQSNTDCTERVMYSADLAQTEYEKNKKKCGRGLKIGDDYKFLCYVEEKIIEHRLSPEAVLFSIKKDNCEFDTNICLTTLYNYIKSGVFLNITLDKLPYRSKKNKAVKRKVQKRSLSGVSIDERPKDIDSRQEFGHWEMDTVVGARGRSKKSFLVLTERKTRYELLIKLKKHTAEEVCKALDYLERYFSGKLFRKIFKTITVDNGVEFSDYAGIEKSRVNRKNRTKVYYCHTYTSCERASNENNNKLVRRWLPKGTVFDNITDSDVKNLQDWMNNYPRKMFGGKSSYQMLLREPEAKLLLV